MKNIVVLSDTHNKMRLDSKLYTVLDECDYIIHLGDGLKDARELKSAFGEKFFAIEGNCDSLYAKEFELLQVEDVKILFTHGHCQNVKSNTKILEMVAKSNQANLVLFGHTHKPIINKVEELTIINPGSLMSANTYCYLTIIKDKILAKIVSR